MKSCIILDDEKVLSLMQNSGGVRIQQDLFYLLSYVGKGHGGLYNAPIREERIKRKAKRRERDQIKFIDLGVER